jgi:hypothetical protein
MSDQGSCRLRAYGAKVRTMDAFAREDGFADWPEMQAFWRVNHPGAPVFSGVLIRWGALL